MVILRKNIEFWQKRRKKSDKLLEVSSTPLLFSVLMGEYID